MTESLEPMSLEAAVQTIIRGLKDKPFVEVKIVRQGRGLITSELMKRAVAEAVEGVPPALGKERFRYLDNLDVQLKGHSPDGVTFCAYRFYR